MKITDNTTKEKLLGLIDSEYESDAAFERELGLPSKTVNNWRRGRSSSYMKMLPRLAESFDISIGELMDLPIKKDTSELSEDELQLLKRYRATSVLSPGARLALYKTLESVIELYLSSAPSAQKTKRGSK